MYARMRVKMKQLQAQRDSIGVLFPLYENIQKVFKNNFLRLSGALLNLSLRRGAACFSLFCYFDCKIPQMLFFVLRRKFEQD